MLSIGGSDPSSGAGVQSDIRTWSELGAWGFSVITALTSQNSARYTRTEAVSVPMLNAQMDAVLADFEIDVVKISMVYSTDIIRAIHDRLKKEHITTILDPVMVSSTGGILLRKRALGTLKRLLLSVSDIVTPNVTEAQALSGVHIKTRHDLKQAAQKIRSYGAKSVVVTGWPNGNHIEDIVFDETITVLQTKRLSTENHGGGCIHSAALAVALAEQKNLIESAKFAQDYAFNAITSSQMAGHGIPIAGKDKTEYDILKKAVARFVSIGTSKELIPECQTNFVYAKRRAKDIHDVLGVDGRLVRTQNGVAMAGVIRYGGSRHVASAIMAVQRRFPSIRSAINIRYDKRYTAAARRHDLAVSHYDRKAEPTAVRDTEGRSISWGISEVMRSSTAPPDLIYHKGHYGKEPMIMVFGGSPQEVLDKLIKITA